MQHQQQTEAAKMIPEGWRITTLAELGETFGGLTGKTKRDFGHGYARYITFMNIMSNVVIDCDALERVNVKSSEAQHHVIKGDLFFNGSSETPDEVGMCAVLEDDLQGVFLNSFCFGFRLREGARVDGLYLAYYFRSPAGRELLKSLAQGAIRYNLSKTALLKTSFPLPPIGEQEAIAEALSDADALVESLERLLGKKRQLKQGVMQELLTGKSRLPGFSGKWRSCLLGDVITSCSSGATPYRGRPDFYQGPVKWITSGELNYNVISDTIEHISHEAVSSTNLKVHPAGTFLMAITGLEAAGTRGACGIVGTPATTNQSCMAIYPSTELLTGFLFQYYVLRGNELALRYCQGTKQQSYTATLVRLLPIDLPPTPAEQSAIVTILEDIDADIAALEAKLAKARQVKQGMMQQLLTGRIRLV